MSPTTCSTVVVPNPTASTLHRAAMRFPAYLSVTAIYFNTNQAQVEDARYCSADRGEKGSVNISSDADPDIKFPSLQVSNKSISNDTD